MLAAFDVHYLSDGTACAAAVLFHRYTDAQPSCELTAWNRDVFRYTPGQFYKRELPCILKLVEQFNVLPREMLVDGYVMLGAQPGLGFYLFEFFHRKIPVIGVAKSRYRGATAHEVFRGRSKKPLYVTAAGMALSEAAQRIASMHGADRLPTLLKRADFLARGRPGRGSHPS